MTASLRKSLPPNLWFSRRGQQPVDMSEKHGMLTHVKLGCNPYRWFRCDCGKEELQNGNHVRRQWKDYKAGKNDRMPACSDCRANGRNWRQQ